jgi:Putative binding domain, N-terminal/Viral BACON domain
MPGMWNVLARRAVVATLLTGPAIAIGAVFAPAEAVTVDCTYTVAPLNKAAVSAGESPIVNVSVAGAGCSWTAVSNDSWITVTSGASGTSTGPVGLTIAANTGATARTGTVTIAGQTLTITQSGPGTCLYSVMPLTKSALAAGDSGNVTVTTGANCAWTAASNSGWISVTSNPITVGPGTATLTIAQNPDATQRIGSMTIAGQTYTVTQAAQPGCTYTISPLTKSAVAAGETTTAAVTATPGCAWTAVSPVEWIAITDGASGTGNGTVTMAIATNSGTTQRSAAVTIAGRTFTITQVGTGACAFTLGPTATSSPAAGEMTSATVTTGNTCVWSAASGAPWILVSAGSSGGTGSGTVTMTIAANSGAQRIAAVTIAGQSFTVTQAPGSCTYTVTPATLTIPATGLSSSLSVATAAGCSWAASGMPSWITATTATQSGPGLLSYAIAANTGSVRTVTLTIGGQPVTVSQSGPVPLPPLNLRVVREPQ